MDMIEHRVRERAYYIWEGEGRVFGRADAHWIQAETELAEAAPVAAMSVVQSPAKAAVARVKAPARAKAAAPKVAAPKTATTATKAKKASRPAEAGGIALH